MLVAARASGIEAIDGPCFNLTPGSSRLAEECAETSALGYAGKWAIHPSQIDAINAAYTPTADTVARAQGILAALADAIEKGAGIALYDGGMVDEAMRLGAERVLARAGVPL